MYLEITDSPLTCVDPKRCAHCPPDRVCAWACEQGWGVHEIAVHTNLIQNGVLAPPADPEEDIASVRQGIWEGYN